jgi:glycerophosphoryl diester phosphodiesterase
MDAIINNDCEYIEVDIMCDTDDFLMMHDLNVDRLTGINKNVTDIPQSERNLMIKPTIMCDDSELLLSYDKSRKIPQFIDIIKELENTNSNKKLCLDLKVTNFDEKDTNSKDRINKLCEYIIRAKKYIFYVSSFDFSALKFIKSQLPPDIDIGLFMSTKKYNPNKFLQIIKPKYKIYNFKDIKKLNRDDDGVLNIVYTIHIDLLEDVKKRYSNIIDYIIIDTYENIKDITSTISPDSTPVNESAPISIIGDSKSKVDQIRKETIVELKPIGQAFSNSIKEK